MSVTGPDGRFVGAAVLISESLVLTGAHVVNSALGRTQFETATPPPNAVVSLCMPHVDPDRVLSARAEPEMWCPPRVSQLPGSGPVPVGQAQYFGDLAVLRLSEPAPHGAEPAAFLPEREGHEVVALWASGHELTTLRAMPRAVAESWIALDVIGGAAYEGCSGGPLWDRTREAVVGIVIATHIPTPGGSDAAGSPSSLYAIGLPTIEAELPELPPLTVPTAVKGRQQLLLALEQLLPGGNSVRVCEARLSAKLRRESAGQAADSYRLLSLATGVRRGVPELVDVIREYMVDSGPVGFPAGSAHWDQLLCAARVVSPRELLTVQQRRDLVGLLVRCDGGRADLAGLLRAVLPYVDELPPVQGLVDATDSLEGYDQPGGRLVPPLLQAVIRIGLTEGAAESSVAQDLDAWVDRVAVRLGVPTAAVYQYRQDARQSSATRRTEGVGPRIQIELLPLAPGHRFTYQIWVWTGEGRHEVVQVQDSEVTSAQVVEGIRAALRTEVQEHVDQAQVEFFLAPAWLRLEVDTWRLAGDDEESGFFLGISRRVVLRSSGRTRDSYAGWRRRTAALTSSRPVVLDHRSTDPEVAQAQLEAVPNAGIVIMCCEQKHQSRILLQCLQAGVHTVLWNRQDHDSHAAKQLLDLLHGISHVDIPETVRLERARALADPDCLTHHGRRLSLLYDGPDHRPPPFAPDPWALTQP
ncbi:trypsin-like peptidase domain-containing protein [Streptomyces sp. SID14515]|uniref:VMAP-C domain-containing protein n=1 Tax=Streptomyces sp. SID14515 TaxID=2706074 RepID=UPI001EF36BDA|nr:trypsin-like peptidase domain-containing protein [Streptomyces sp. SID14515]